MQDYQLKETCAVTLFGTVGAPLPYLLFTKRLQKSNRPLHSGILVVLLRFWLIPITILDQVAMTGKLSRVFPAEILSMFFENLLPKIDRTEDMHIGLGDTRDLLQCRLVCRTFYVLTSRWVWRRVVLNFGPISESIFPTTNESRPFAICNFFLAHPEVSKHVRYLRISARFGQKLDIFHRAPIHTLGSALLAIAPLLQNLRLLGVAIDQPLPWWQALDALFSLPLLLRMIWLSKDI